MFRLPGAGELVQDLEPETDNLQQQQGGLGQQYQMPPQRKQLEEQLARQHYFLKQYLTPEQQAQLGQQKHLTPEETEEYHRSFLQYLSPEQQLGFKTQFQQQPSGSFFKMFF